LIETPGVAFSGDLNDLMSAVGTTFGPAAAVRVSQDRIQKFAEATDDLQWIHVDAARAAQGPFGTTIAHGYLTLALLPRFLAELVEVKNVDMGVNYGLNKVRFPAPLPSGSLITASVTVAQVYQSSVGAQVTFDVVIVADDIEKPICAAQAIVLYVG
jgi:acyl dehydratase